MLDRPPLIRTDLLPADIIGQDNMAAFKQHMKITCKRIDGGWPENDIKKLSEGVRFMVAEALKHLFEHGYVVAGIDWANDRVLFGVILQSKSDQLFEGPEFEAMKRMNPGELAKMARDGYRKLKN